MSERVTPLRAIRKKCLECSCGSKYGMDSDCPVEDEWVFRLIAAIIIRAREDYVLGDDEVECFVYSNWFATITDVNQDWFMEQLRKARRDKNRKYNSRDWSEKFDR